MTGVPVIHEHPRHLGLRTLAELVSGTGAGIAVLDTDRTVVYANPAACRLLGRPSAPLRGRDVVECLPVAERSSMSNHLDATVAGLPDTFTVIVHDAEGAEREIACSASNAEDDGRSLVLLSLWDQSGPQSAARTAAALAQTAAQLPDSTSTTELLDRLSRLAVEHTRSRWCGFGVAGENDRFVDGGSHGPSLLARGAQRSGWAAIVDQSATEWISAMTAGAAAVGSPPNKPIVLPNARTIWESDPRTCAYAAAITELEYEAGVCVPLTWQNRVIGLCILRLPPEVPVLTDSELAFVTAVADQATLAIMNGRLRAQTGVAAAMRERGRVARELHDSVSQALFSITMHARAANLAMTEAGADPDGRLGRSLGELSELARVALAEMRALIFELRPDALAEAGVIEAVRKQTTALSAREKIAITMETPDRRIPLDPKVEEQVYRITVEALHNIVKHARASHVAVSIKAAAQLIRITIADDGVGFDPTERRLGHLGLRTMAERAAAIGAQLTITSSPGVGTTVSVQVAPYAGDTSPSD